MSASIDEAAGAIRAIRATLLSIIDTHPLKTELLQRLRVAGESELSVMLNESVSEEYITAFEKTMRFYQAAAGDLPGPAGRSAGETSRPGALGAALAD